MSSEPYLVAHIVRGEPAFDIAERMEVVIGEDEWGKTLVETFWIIPTSGHRAYPYWTFELRKLMYLDAVVWETEATMDGILKKMCPPNHPDHYSTSAAPRGQGLIKNLAERLGFVPKPPMITRR